MLQFSEVNLKPTGCRACNAGHAAGPKYPEEENDLTSLVSRKRHLKFGKNLRGGGIGGVFDYERSCCHLDVVFQSQY